VPSPDSTLAVRRKFLSLTGLDSIALADAYYSSLAMGNELARTEIPPGTLYMLILRSLARLGPMHGYGIAQHIQQLSQEVLQVEEGSLYPALQRMLIKGWVTADWAQSENNRRARYYRLTPAGKKQLNVEMSEFDRVMRAIANVIQPA